ncbi:MAG: ATP-binding protein [Myxococcota bacterium]
METTAQARLDVLLAEVRELQSSLAQPPDAEASPQAGAAVVSFQEAVARVSSAIVAARGTDEMLVAVLDAMLEVFDCDRAWLLFPCDPESESWSVPMERTRPEWPGAGQTGVVIPMNDFARDTFTRALASDEPVWNDPEHDPYPTDDPFTAVFRIRSLLMVAIHPKRGKPWCLGIHHCGAARVYSRADRELFRVLGSRIADGLTSRIVEQELRSSQERFRIIIEHAPEAIAIVDVATGHLVGSNRAAATLYEAEAETLAKLTLADLSPEFQPDGRHSSRALAEMLAAAGEGGAPTAEWTHRGLNGTETPCEIRMVRLPGRESVQVRVSATDISERVRAEARRQRLEEELRHAQRLKAIGELTGGIAHDFNNLLTAILGNMEVARDRADDPARVTKHLGHAIAGVDRAADLTRRLLAFGRKQSLRPQVVDLNALVADMDNLLRRTLGEAVAIETIHAGDLWGCEVDPGQLENAILNLAINARDATEGRGRLTIETANVRLDDRFAGPERDTLAGDHVMVAVTDDGHGMPAEIQRKAFDPFFSTKPRGKGSGLGLSMVYGFVKQSGGDVRIESEVGRGTTVRIYLPRATGATHLPAPIRPAADEPRGSGEHVLVVEDNPAVRQSTVAVLTVLGYRTTEAPSAEIALRTLASDPSIELLFSDVLLPGGLSGIELLVEARKVRPELPVLLTSGFADAATLSAAGPAAGAHLLDKPFSKSDLARRIHQVLAAGRALESQPGFPTG